MLFGLQFPYHYGFFARDDPAFDGLFRAVFQKIVTFSVFMLLPKRSRFAGLLYVTSVRPRNLNENVLLTVKNSLASAGLKDSTGFPPPMEVKGFAPQVIMSHISMNSAVEPTF